jgi:hypothetical protein
LANLTFSLLKKRAHWLMVFIMCCIWMTKFSNHNPIIDDKSIDNPYSMEVWVSYTLKTPLLKLRFIGWWHSHKEIHYFWLASLKQKISLRFWSLKSRVLFYGDVQELWIFLQVLMVRGIERGVFLVSFMTTTAPRESLMLIQVGVTKSCFM